MPPESDYDSAEEDSRDVTERPLMDMVPQDAEESAYFKDMGKNLFSLIF